MKLTQGSALIFFLHKYKQKLTKEDKFSER